MRDSFLPTKEIQASAGRGGSGKAYKNTTYCWEVGATNMQTSPPCCKCAQIPRESTKLTFLNICICTFFFLNVKKLGAQALFERLHLSPTRRFSRRATLSFRRSRWKDACRRPVCWISLKATAWEASPPLPLPPGMRVRALPARRVRRRRSPRNWLTWRRRSVKCPLTSVSCHCSFFILPCTVESGECPAEETHSGPLDETQKKGQTEEGEEGQRKGHHSTQAQIVQISIYHGEKHQDFYFVCTLFNELFVFW